MKKEIWIYLLILLIFGGGFWLVFKDYKKSPQRGKEAPEFSLPDRSGKLRSLKDYRGKVVLLNFWATWCGPCVSEMDSLERLYQKFKGRNFEVIGVSLDERGFPAIDEFQRKIPVHFTLLLDANYSVAEKYGTYRVPETYLIDPQGKVIQKIVGPQDWASEEWIKKVEHSL